MDVAAPPKKPVVAYLATFRTPQVWPKGPDLARAAIGGGIGILITALVGEATAVGPAELPWIVAPLGATAVLLFAVPASPLAQPWAAVGGNVSAAIVAVTVTTFVGWKPLACALAVGLAIGVMLLLRCLHPPGGAIALLAAYSSPAIEQHGYWFAAWPVAVNTLTIVCVALVFNNLVGRRYPHVAPAVPTAPPGQRPAPAERTGVQLEDVERALAIQDGLDITPADVLGLVREAEAHALDRRFGGLQVAAVMEGDVVTAIERESAYRVRLLLEQHQVKAVPVVDDERRVVGIVSILDLFRRDLGDVAPVSQVMTSPVTTIGQDAPVSALISLMVEQGFRHVPVVDADQRLVGLVTRAELIGLMHRLLVRP